MNIYNSSRLGSPFAALACVILASSAHGATLYSWETDFENWAAQSGYTAAVSSVSGVTAGSSALQLSAPASGMWWSVGVSKGLSSTELTQIFNNASAVTLDVTYNPSGGTWYLDGQVSLGIQSEKVSWQTLSWVTVPKGTTATTATWSITPSLASDMATSSWGEVFFVFTYGNGGADPVNLYIDNFTSDAFTAVPEPSSYALALGLAAIGGVLSRRRHRA